MRCQTCHGRCVADAHELGDGFGGPCRTCNGTGVEPEPINKPTASGSTRGLHAQRAADWMQANPQVMQSFADYALQAHHAGVRIGIALLVERVRWLGVVERRDAAGFKINNNHRAYIARELIRRHPVLAEVIELREVRQ